MRNREKLIKEFKKFGMLEIYLNDNEVIYVDDSHNGVYAERNYWDTQANDWGLSEKYGTFEKIEDLLNMLEEKGVLTFKN